jgi:hypothetical protein
MLLVFHNVQQRGHEYEGCYVRRAHGSVVRRDQSVVRPDGGVIRFEGEFRVLFVQRIGPTAVKTSIEQIAREGPCPVCGVLSSVVKDRPLTRVKDLPACGQTVELWSRKRRLRCGERLCPRSSFTQTAAAVRPRGRVTERLTHARDRDRRE